MTSEQIKFCADLDDKGLRPVVDQLAQQIEITSRETTEAVCSPNSGIYEPLRSMIAGSWRYGRDQETMRLVATLNGFPLIPNRYRATAKIRGYIFQSRRFKSLQKPHTGTVSLSQPSLFDGYVWESSTVVFIGAYYAGGKGVGGKKKTFEEKFSKPSKIVIATLDSSLSAFAIPPIDVRAYLAGEHLQTIGEQKPTVNKTKKPDVKGFIKKDLEQKKERRQKRSNE